jgi:hypothetical protein
MSAHQLTATHIAAMVGTYETSSMGHQSAEERQKLASLLAAENARSVNHRYSGNAAAQCEPVEVSNRLITHFMLHPLGPGEMLNAIACYEYQACESTDWEATEAHRLCRRMSGLTARRVPGYDSAPWGIGDLPASQVSNAISLTDLAGS